MILVDYQNNNICQPVTSVQRQTSKTKGKNNNNKNKKTKKKKSAIAKTKHTLVYNDVSMHTVLFQFLD